MKISFLAAAVALVCFIAPNYSEPLPRSTPEREGIASRDLLGFVRALDEKVDAMHSVMLLRHGKVVAEGWWTPYSAESRHELYSLSKSFTSTAVGLAVSEGKLSLDDPILKYFTDEAPENPSANLRAMRIRDLLRMCTGHQVEPSLKGTGNWARAFLAQPVPNKPGTHFLYNTAATYMLSAMVQKTTGETVLDYLRPRLFDPLGIDNPAWNTSPQGISLGGYGLSVRTEDIARFGQLYLQEGEWHGRQLVPRSWVKAATTLQTANGSRPDSDWDQGYCYQFWRCRHGAYRGDGAFGQYCVVMPEEDAVLAITSGTKDMQNVLNIVWERLLPAIRHAALPEDSRAHSELTGFLARLTLPFAQGNATPGEAAIEHMGKRYAFEENKAGIEAITLKRESSGKQTLVFRIKGAEYSLSAGQGGWEKGRLAYGTMAEQAAALSGEWSSANTYAVKIAFYETPFVLSGTLKFSGDELLYKSDFNVGFGGLKTPELKGRVE
jgi:CubicO group peptidase (beta-lactamase class C family)